MPSPAPSSPKALPTLVEIEAAIGPAATWAGHCHETACAIVEAGLVNGVPVYGEWLGPIAKESHFGDKQGVPFHHHGWLALDDGRVLDPTRWAFEGTTPYLYVGPAGPEYDEGGNRVRLMQLSPPPREGPNDRIVEIDAMSPDALAVMRTLLDGPHVITMPMLVWLANLPVEILGDDAAILYDSISNAGYGGLIPIDNLQLVARGGTPGPAPSA